MTALMPGLDPDKDMHVAVAEGVLTISANRREEEHARGRSEFRYGMLRRSVRLPANADTEKIVASYEKGVLAVTVPLTAPEHAGRQIPVTSG